MEKAAQEMMLHYFLDLSPLQMINKQPQRVFHFIPLPLHAAHTCCCLFSRCTKTLQPDSSNSKAELFVVDLESNETAPAKWRVTPPSELTDRY
jgi:hypothetical protein